MIFVFLNEDFVIANLGRIPNYRFNAKQVMGYAP